jgi:hypothetical protein
MRTTSADTHLHATCSQVRLPARRSASFMLSPTSPGGHMSAVLASASALCAASGEQLVRPGAGSFAEHILRDGLGPAHASTAAPLAGDDPSATAFLSMSPTMQWLQVEFSSLCPTVVRCEPEISAMYMSPEVAVRVGILADGGGEASVSLHAACYGNC